jgi:hypothetical protein
MVGERCNTDMHSIMNLFTTHQRAHSSNETSRTTKKKFVRSDIFNGQSTKYLSEVRATVQSKQTDRIKTGSKQTEVSPPLSRPLSSDAENTEERKGVKDQLALVAKRVVSPKNMTFNNPCPLRVGVPTAK